MTKLGALLVAATPRASVRLGFAGAALVAAMLASPGVARAADGHAQQDLEQAEQALVNLDYDAANKGAARVVQQRGLTHEQLVRAYRVLALTDAVLDKETAAREAFQLLLTYDPAYQGDPNLGPKVQAPFMEARGFIRAQAVQSGVEVAVVLRPSEPGTIRVTTRDPTHVAKRAAVSYRWGGEGAYTSAPVAVADGATTDVPPPPTGTTRLDYYVQVFDEHDGAVFEAGNASVPRSATVDLSSTAVLRGSGAEPAKSEHHSIFASPIFWTVTAVVLAGAGTAVYFATRSKSTNVETPGTTAPPTSAALAPALQCGLTGQRCD